MVLRLTVARAGVQQYLEKEYITVEHNSYFKAHNINNFITTPPSIRQQQQTSLSPIIISLVLEALKQYTSASIAVSLFTARLLGLLTGFLGRELYINKKEKEDQLPPWQQQHHGDCLF